MMKYRKAFTMMEITIAIAILIVLSALMMPRMADGQEMEKAKLTAKEILVFIETRIRDADFGYPQENSDIVKKPCAGDYTYTDMTVARILACTGEDTYKALKVTGSDSVGDLTSSLETYKYSEISEAIFFSPISLSDLYDPSTKIQVHLNDGLIENISEDPYLNYKNLVEGYSIEELEKYANSFHFRTTIIFPYGSAGDLFETYEEAYLYASVIYTKLFSENSGSLSMKTKISNLCDKSGTEIGECLPSGTTNKIVIEAILE